MRKTGLAIALVLAGCTLPGEDKFAPPQLPDQNMDQAFPAEDTPQDPDTALPEQCDAADYRPLIGTAIAEAGLPAGDRLRIYAMSDIITQEYLPQRTNVVVDGQGLILRVDCG